MGILAEGKLIPKTTQLALFFGPGRTFKALDVAKMVTEGFSFIFQAEPNVLSLTPEAPPEIPRVLLQQNEVGQIAVGYLRGDLTLNWKKDPGWSDTVIKTSEILAEGLAGLAIPIQRIGFVFTFDLAKEITINDLRSRYICPGKMDDSLDLRFAWLRRIKANEQVVNRWMQFLYEINPAGNRNLTIDTNTLAEEDLHLDSEAIKELVKAWLEEILDGDIDAIIEW